MITGASGTLGHAFCEYLVGRGHTVVGAMQTHPVSVDGVTEYAVDVCEARGVSQLVAQVAPDVIVHTAAHTNVDGCERDPAAAERLNVEATRNVAGAARDVSAKLIHISTDHLWRGDAPMTVEDQPPTPLNVYARTKLDAEQVAMENADALIVRTSFFGEGRPWRKSFSDWVADGLRGGTPLRMFTDAFFSPIATALLCPLLAEMAARDARGVFNVCGRTRLSKYDFAVRLAVRMNIAADVIEASRISDAQLTAPRPPDMSLATEKVEAFLGREMPSIDESLDTLAILKQAPSASSGVV